MKNGLLHIRNKRISVICVAFLTVLLTASPSFANYKSGVKSGDCRRDGKYVVCSGGGSSSGGGGHYTNGNSGSGSYSNRAAVRFDGFAPDPARIKCGEPNKYIHYRVALSRDGKEVLAGVPGSKYWDTAWDVNTGLPVPGGAPEKDGLTSRSDTLIGPHWEFNKAGSNVSCRELLAPQDVTAQLKLLKPLVEFKSKQVDSTMTTITNKAVVNQKNSKVIITIDQSKMDGDIPIKFDLIATAPIIKMYNKVSGDYEPLPQTQKKMSFKNASTVDKEELVNNPDGSVTTTLTSTTTQDVKFKNKGKYKVTVLAVFNVYIGGETEPKALWLLSDEANLEVVSVKAVSFKKN